MRVGLKYPETWTVGLRIIRTIPYPSLAKMLFLLGLLVGDGQQMLQQMADHLFVGQLAMLSFAQQLRQRIGEGGHRCVPPMQRLFPLGRG